MTAKGPLFTIAQRAEHIWETSSSATTRSRPIINTRDSEYSPFYSRSHDVFYFSSNGHILNFDDLNEHHQKYL